MVYQMLNPKDTDASDILNISDINIMTKLEIKFVKDMIQTLESI